MMARRRKVLRYPDGTPKDDDRCAATIHAKDPLTLFADGWDRPCRRPRQRGYQYCWQHQEDWEVLAAADPADPDGWYRE